MFGGEINPGIGFIFTKSRKNNVKELQQNFPVFCHKIKSMYLTKILRHSLADQNVFNAWLRFLGCKISSYQDTRVQKIKEER